MNLLESKLNSIAAIAIDASLNSARLDYVNENFYNKSFVISALNNKQSSIVEAPATVSLGQPADYTYFIDSTSVSYPLFNSKDIVWTKFNNNISFNISNEFKNTYLTTTAASLIYARADELSNFETTTSMLNSVYQTITGMSSYVTSGSLTAYQPVANMATYITSGSLTTYVTSGSLTAYQPVADMLNYVTSGSLTVYQPVANMVNYVTSGSLTAYQTISNMSTYVTSGSLVAYVTSGSLTAYQTIADLTKSSVGLGNVDNTGASSLPISTATQTALGLKANIESPIFTGNPKLTISGLNYDLITQPWVGGWFQFSSMTVQKQIGLHNFSVVRSAGFAAGSFDISFPSHPAGGSYMIIFTPRLSSGAPVLYGYGGVINATGFTVRFSNISGTNIDAEFSLFIPRN